jgi:hypothetical protein
MFYIPGVTLKMVSSSLWSYYTPKYIHNLKKGKNVAIECWNSKFLINVGISKTLRSSLFLAITAISETSGAN